MSVFTLTPATKTDIMKKITQGKWKIFTINQLGINLKATFGIKGKDSVCIVNYHKDQQENEAKANANAIVNAVNNTYGKGIDPEKVGKLKALLDSQEFSDICSMYRMAPPHDQDKVVNRFNAIKELILESIKLEDK